MNEALCKPGTILLERYEIRELLGMGGMGWVYKAVDFGLDQQLVALKILYPHLLFQENAHERFHAEVLITRKLSHPNIVQTYSFDSAGPECYFISMECVEGSTLRSLVNMDGSRLFEEQIKVLYEIASGLAYAHQRGVVHRDLKPENVLLSNDGTIKVGDFGISQVVQQGGSDTPAQTVQGSPYYMSPEQFAAKVLGPESDVYSFGVLSYELLFGVVPFKGNSLFELAESHCHKKVEFSSRQQKMMPAWFKNLICCCMEKEPCKRSSSMNEVCEHIASEMGYRMERVETSAMIELEQKPPERVLWKHVEEDSIKTYNIGLCIIALAVVLCLGLYAIVDRKPDYLIGAFSFFVIGICFTQEKVLARWVIAGTTFLAIILAIAPRQGEIRIRLGAGLLHLERLSGIEIKFAKDYLNLPFRVDNADDMIELASGFDAATFRTMLFADMDPNQRNSNGQILLSRVIALGRRNIFVHLLRDSRTDLNVPEADGNTPLHVAVAVPGIYYVRALIEAGTHRGLIEERVNPNVYNKEGRTPLSLAVIQNDSQKVKYLLRTGAEANLSISMPGIPGISLLGLAVKMQNPSMVRALLQAGAPLTIGSLDGKSVLDIAREQNPNSRNYLEILRLLNRYQEIAQATDSSSSTTQE